MNVELKHIQDLPVTVKPLLQLHQKSLEYGNINMISTGFEDNLSIIKGNTGISTNSSAGILFQLEKIFST